MATASFKKRDATPTARASDSAQQPAPNRNSSSPSGDSLVFLTTAAGQQRIAKLLELGLNEFQQKLNRDYLANLKNGFVAWMTTNLKDVQSRLGSVSQLRRETWLQGERQGSQAPRFLCDFLVFTLHEELEQLKKLKAVNKMFQRNVASATTQRDRREIILHFAAELGASPSELDADEAARDAGQLCSESTCRSDGAYLSSIDGV